MLVFNTIDDSIDGQIKQTTNSSSENKVLTVAKFLRHSIYSE
jgi:hypothetical protein